MSSHDGLCWLDVRRHVGLSVVCVKPCWLDCPGHVGLIIDCVKPSWLDWSSHVGSDCSIAFTIQVSMRHSIDFPCKVIFMMLFRTIGLVLHDDLSVLIACLRSLRPSLFVCFVVLVVVFAVYFVGAASLGLPPPR